MLEYMEDFPQSQITLSTGITLNVATAGPRDGEAIFFSMVSRNLTVPGEIRSKPCLTGISVSHPISASPQPMCASSETPTMMHSSKNMVLQHF